jgi:DNA-binding XRE family transcriptional regulator
MNKNSALKLERLLQEPASDDVSDLLKLWRETQALTQTCAAEILGVAPRTLQGWELGRPMPFPRLLQGAIFSHTNSKSGRTIFLNNLPKKIGARIQIPTADHSLRREVEARGFVMERATPNTYFMRRDFNDGFLKTSS